MSSTDAVSSPNSSLKPHHRRRIAANFLAMVASSVLAKIAGVFTSVFIRRVLGPVAIGEVSWNGALLSYLGLLSTGVQLVGQREVAKRPADTARLTSLILSLQFILAAGAYGFVLLLAAFPLRGPHLGALLAVQGLGLFLTAANVGWVLQGRERMVGTSIAGLVLTVLQIPALVAFVHRPEDVFIYVVYTMPFTALGVVYNFWSLQRHGFLRLGDLRPTLAGAAAVLRQSWPLALSTGAMLIYAYNCDALILGFTHGDKAVGLYTTAYNLMLVPAMISGALWSAYFPVMARAQRATAQAAEVCREFTTLLAWAGLPIAVLGWTFGRHVIDLMYGPEFGDSGRYFEWLCLDIPLVFINMGIGTPLVSWGYQTLHLKITATAAAVNLALNLVLIPIYGPWGAVVTTIGAEAVVFVLGLWARRRIGEGAHPWLPVLLPPLACSAAVAAVLKVLPPALAPYWVSQCILGGAALLLCLFIFEKKLVIALVRILQKA